MALTITGNLMSSTDTRHTARLTESGWAVTRLTGKVPSRDEAITAMTIADVVGRDRHNLTASDPLWPHIDGWAAELGMSGPDAAARASRVP
jgi:hypothetical protein